VLLLKKIVNRVYTLRIGTRTALSFFAVVFVALFFSVAATLLLQYSKNIDTKISNSFSPVISAIRDYQYIIEETGRLAQDLIEQYDENKLIRLEKILDVQYNRSKVTVIGLCQEPGLNNIKDQIIASDKQFNNLRKNITEILPLIKNKSIYQPDALNNERKQQLNTTIESEVSVIRTKLSETSLEAIKAFRKLETQKYASYRTLSYLMLVMIVVIVLVSAISIYLTRVTIIKPIKELSFILEEVGKGKFVNFETNIKRLDEIGHMIKTTQKMVQGFKQKAMVANAIGKGNYKMQVPLLSKDDKLGKALEEMRKNLDETQTKLENNLLSLQEYTIDLEKKNKELDQFAYITSHDLKSPLRGINNLSEWIMEDMGDRLTEDSRKYFELLRGRVMRMEALIDSILKYSRAGKSFGEKEMVNTKQVVIQALNKVKPGANFKIFYDETLPEIYGNKKDIEEVFLNFISNAVLHNNAQQPIVNITYTELDNHYRFCIADNGQGIKPEFHQKIFTFFQTLETRDKIEATGAGLAIVKKIIESYEGKVWVESEEGKGARFYFTWPKKENINTATKTDNAANNKLTPQGPKKLVLS
jgi:signal transduction histidine kinase